MKNYDDFAEEVFREADRRLALKRKRAAVIRQYTLAFASMFAIILTGIFVIKNETVREALEKKFNAQNIITDESSVTAPPTNTTVPDHGSYEPEITTEVFTSQQPEKTVGKKAVYHRVSLFPFDSIMDLCL